MTVITGCNCGDLVSLVITIRYCHFYCSKCSDTPHKLARKLNWKFSEYCWQWIFESVSNSNQCFSNDKAEWSDFW